MAMTISIPWRMSSGPDIRVIIIRLLCTKFILGAANMLTCKPTGTDHANIWTSVAITILGALNSSVSCQRLLE